jgi:hypothetical protein
LGSHSSSSSSDSEDSDVENLKDRAFERWDTQIQALAITILTARVLEVGAPVKKLSQLALHLIDF